MRPRLDLQIRFLLKDLPRTLDELIEVTKTSKNDIMDALTQLSNRNLVRFDKKRHHWKSIE